MERLNGRTILVTGADGFLGRHVIERLKQDHVTVHAVSRNVPVTTCEMQCWRGDLTNAEWLQQIVSSIKPDIIFHLASASLGGQDAQFVLPTFENDLRTTVNMLLAARTSGCSRLVLVASLEEPILDGRPLAISSPYAAAKAACTYYGLMFHQLYGIPVTVLRPFMTYGPGQKPFKIVPYTILSMLKGEAPKLSSATRPVDWVYVEDVITAFLAACVCPEAVGATIDLGSGELIPGLEVVRQIHRLLPCAPAPLFGARPDRIGETVRGAETLTAQRILGWTATTPLAEGLSKTVEWYRRQRELEG